MCLEAGYRRDQLQPCVNSLLCIVLVSLGEAEVNQDAISPVYAATKPPKCCTVSAMHLW